MAGTGRVWRILRIVILILVALVAGFFLLFVPWYFSGFIKLQFHYRDANDGKTPASYNLTYQSIEFQSKDGVALKGWYIPAKVPARGTIIYSHGLNRSRVEMLPKAVFGHQIGYNGVLFDFRRHGESGGRVTTIGYKERWDIEAAMQYALEERHAERPVILWGVSMGAAAALLAGAESSDVAAVISDSSFDSFLATAQHHLKLFLHLPAFPIVDEIAYLTAWRAGFSVSDFDLVKAVERIGDRPILFIAVEGDRRMPPAIAQKLYDHARSPLKKVVVLPGNRHGEGFNQATDAYEKAVTEFLAALPAS